MRTRYAIDGGQPIVRDLAVRKAGGQWVTLGQNLTPEYHVVSGIRRMSTQQAEPLKAAGVELTPEVIAKNRWYAFWDAPLGAEAGPRDHRAAAQRVRHQARRARRFAPRRARVKTDGAALEVTFPGLSMGIFAGDLRFTAYRGTNLLRMDALATTNEEWVAYKYEAGLKGFSTDLTPRVVWRDTGGQPQQYAFGGVVQRDDRAGQGAEPRARGGRQRRVARARSRRRTRSSSRARSTPTSATSGTARTRRRRSASASARPTREEKPQYVDNFALFNAPPGHRAAHGRVLLRQPGRRPKARARRCSRFTHGDSSSRCPATRRS